MSYNYLFIDSFSFPIYAENFLFKSSISYLNYFTSFSLSDNLSSEINFRRVENVGPKVSAELLQSGIIAISL